MDADLLKEIISDMSDAEFQEVFRFVNGEAVDREIAKNKED